MAFYSELGRTFCGPSVRGAAYTAICHYMLHGLFVVSFVFSNSCYPPFYWVDYLFGAAGATLLLFSIVGGIVGVVGSFPWLRIACGALITVTVLLTVVATFIYTCERWNDVISTALVRSLRKPVERDFPDYFWYSLTVTSCVFCLLFLIYLIYIVSYFFNQYQNSDPTDMFAPPVIGPTNSRRVVLPTDSYGRPYKPYPVQGSKI